MLMMILIAAVAAFILLAALRIILGIFLPRPALQSFDRGVGVMANFAGKFSVLCFATLILGAIWMAYKSS